MGLKYKINGEKVQARAAELGLTLQAAAFLAGLSMDTMRRVYFKPISFTEKTVLGVAKALEMDAKNFATRAL